jgi:hypothetical protein
MWCRVEIVGASHPCSFTKSNISLTAMLTKRTFCLQLKISAATFELLDRQTDRQTRHKGISRMQRGTELIDCKIIWIGCFRWNFKLTDLETIYQCSSENRARGRPLFENRAAIKYVARLGYIAMWCCGTAGYTRVYPKVPGLAAWSENWKWYSCH